MEHRTRTRLTLRRAAMTAAAGALLVPATAGAATTKHHSSAKLPAITSVAPKRVMVSQWLEIRGRNFRRGRNKNTVVFKRDGARAVFVKAQLGTAKLLKVQVPDKLQEFFMLKNGAPQPTRFRLRVLATRFSRSFTSAALSPTVWRYVPPAAPPAPAADGDCDGDGIGNRSDADADNDGLTNAVELSLALDVCKPDTDADGLLDKWEFDCDRDGVLNRDESDDDNDLLSDDLETSIGTDPCNADTDGDHVSDGYEYQSARDLNDDEYQEPNRYLPYPGKRPYPNPLDDSDAATDHDGDSLTLAEEYALWRYSNGNAQPDHLYPLSYSAGEQYSAMHRGADGRRVNDLRPDDYAKQREFVAWAAQTPRFDGGNGGYGRVWVRAQSTTDETGTAVGGRLYDIRDANLDGTVSTEEAMYFDIDGNGAVSDDERDEDADGLTNYDEAHGGMLPEYWSGCYALETPYKVAYAGTSLVDADSDGDGVRDGADDQDHDDIPNLMELSRLRASRLWDGKRLCVPAEDLVPDYDHAPVDKLKPLDATKFVHADRYGRVNPFNPCLPDTGSRTCDRHPSLSGPSAPFDGSPDWYSLN